MSDTTWTRARGGEVRTFTLVVPAGELRRRIGEQVLVPDDAARDEEVRRWRLAQVDRCVSALTDPGLGEPVMNHERPADGAVDDIVDRLPPSLTSSRAG